VGGAGDGAANHSGEAELIRGGVRKWVLRTERGVRSASPQVLLVTLCAAALGPIVATQTGIAGTAAAGIGALSSVGAGMLTDVVEGVIDRLRRQKGEKGQKDKEVTAPQIEEMLAEEIGKVLAGGEANARALRAEIGAVLKEVDLGGTMLRAAIESEREQIEGDLLEVVDLLGSGFTEMRFLIQDVGAAAAGIQQEIDEQRAGTRVVFELNSEMAAEIRGLRQSLAVIERRTRPDPLADDPLAWRKVRWEGDPYRGLLPFGEADADIFYGRQRMTTDLAVEVAGQVNRGGLIVVTGASGAGKSSLIRAGLLPALAGGLQVQGSEHWPRLVMTPSRDPLAELAAHLAARGGTSAIDVREQLEHDPGNARLAARQLVLADAARHGRPPGTGDARLVVVVDQFEELFTLSPGAQRQRFVSALCAMAARPPDAGGTPVALVVIAVRGDFVDRCAAYPELAAALRDSQFIVEPMTERDLRLTITGPADAAGLQLEPGLVDTVLHDLRAAERGVTAGVLPLLSQAMLLTWQARDGNRLNIHGYYASGGVDRAVQVSADAFYNALPPGSRPLARAILRTMITFGRDSQSVRRQVTRTMLSELPGAEVTQVDAILEGLVARRLVVLGDGTAEIAHDALLTEWPKLRGWLEDDQASWILHGHLAADAAEWDGTRQPDFLYRGIQLASMQHAAAVWAASPDRFPALSPVEQDFLRASDIAHRRRTRLRRVVSASLVLLLVIAATFGVVAWKAAGNADQERGLANQRRSAATADYLATESEEIGPADPVTAAQLAAAAWKIAPTDQARASMLEILGQRQTATLYATGDIRQADGSTANPGVSAVAFSPDGKILATASGDGTARLWDVTTDQQIGPAMVADSGSLANIGEGRNGVTGVAFSPDGKILATVAGDGTARLWDVATGRQIGAPLVVDGAPGGANAVAFSPDGKMLATADADGTAQLWDVATHRQIGSPITVVPHNSQSDQVYTVAFSPDGISLATASEDGTARLWDVATHRQIGTPMAVDTVPGAIPTATAVAFSPDGKTLATADADGTAQFWDVATHRQIGAPITVVPYTGQHDWVYTVAFSPDGKTLATAAEDGTARLWDVATRQQIGEPFTAVSPGDNEVEDVVFSPDGTSLATAGEDGTARLWRLTSYGQIGGPLGGPDDNGGANSVAFSPDGAILAAGYGDGTVRLWDTATRQQIGTPLIADSSPFGLVYGNGVTAVAFSPDGSILATLGADMTVRLWDVATRRQIGTTMAAGFGPATASFPTDFELAFNPEGTILATAGDSGTLLLWNVGTHRLIGAPRIAVSTPTDNFVTGVAFSPDGSVLATAGWDGTVRLWNMPAARQTGPLITDSGDHQFTGVAFSQDGEVLATAGSAGTRLWSVTTHQQIGPAIAVPSGTTSVAFSPRRQRSRHCRVRRHDLAVGDGVPGERH
jgi:WD40 repeat protein